MVDWASLELFSKRALREALMPAFTRVFLPPRSFLDRCLPRPPATGGFGGFRLSSLSSMKSARSSFSPVVWSLPARFGFRGGRRLELLCLLGPAVSFGRVCRAISDFWFFFSSILSLAFSIFASIASSLACSVACFSSLLYSARFFLSLSFCEAEVGAPRPLGPLSLGLDLCAPR